MKLLRRREIWLPTLPGCALLATALALVLTGLALGMPGYLAQTEPAGRGLLVVEGWLPAEAVAGAVETYRRGGYELFVVTGGPIEDEVCPPGFATYAERGASLARGMGLRDDELVIVPAPASAQERTFRSAVSLRQWAERSERSVTALDVYSYGPHARRSRWLFQRAFGDAVTVGVIAAPPARYDPQRWWRTSDGARAVLSEAVAWAWVRLFFDPGARGSREEQWGPPPAAQRPPVPSASRTNPPSSRIAGIRAGSRSGERSASGWPSTTSRSASSPGSTRARCASG